MDSFRKYLYYATIGLFAYMPFHIFLAIWLSTYTGGLDGWKAAKDIFTAVLVSLIVCAVLITRKYTRLFLGLVAFSIIFLLLHLLLMFTTNQPNDTGILGTVYNNRLVWYVLIGYGLALLMPKFPLPKIFVRTLLIVSTVVCLLGLLQWVLPKDLLTHFGYAVERGVKPMFYIDDKPDLPRVFSTLRDPNSLGAFLILPITILAGALLRFWNTQRRMLISGLLMLHLLVLALTFSRSALLGTFLALAAIVLLRYGHQVKVYARRYWLPGAVALAVIIAGVFLLRDQYVVQNVVFHADESTTLDDPNELRVKLFDKGVDGIVDEPLGHGPGTAGLVSTRLPSGLLTENYYLQIGYEVGIAGLILFLGFLVMILKGLWRIRPNPTAQALMASFIGLAFMNWLLHTWANEAVAATWFILAGSVLAINPNTFARAKKSKALVS